MNVQTLIASAVAILLLSGEAFALKEHVRIRPQSQESHGFSVATDRMKEGTVQFVITRELSKARSFDPKSDLEIRRSSTLKVSDKSGLIVECQVDGEKKKETVVYRFTIAQDRIAHSHFTVAEIEDYKDTEGREHFLGGGTFYQFHLADFLDAGKREAASQKPRSPTDTSPATDTCPFCGAAGMTSRILTVAMLTICTASTSLAADQPQRALHKIPETGTIVGRVFAFHNPSLTPEVRVEAVELMTGDDRFKSGEAKVDEEGRFVFKDVPSGRVRLQPTFSASDVHGIRLPSALTFSTTVRSGQTREVALFGKGRPVTGQIRVPPGIDAKKLRIELVLVAPPVRAMFGPSGNKPTPHAHVYDRLRKELGDLSSSLDEHGRFRIEGVREGTYWINVTNLAFASKETPGYPSIKNGKLKIDLMASGESDDPLELGVLIFRQPVQAAERLLGR